MGDVTTVSISCELLLQPRHDRPHRFADSTEKPRRGGGRSRGRAQSGRSSSTRAQVFQERHRPDDSKDAQPRREVGAELKVRTIFAIACSCVPEARHVITHPPTWVFCSWMNDVDTYTSRETDALLRYHKEIRQKYTRVVAVLVFVSWFCFVLGNEIAWTHVHDVYGFCADYTEVLLVCHGQLWVCFHPDDTVLSLCFITRPLSASTLRSIFSRGCGR